MSDSPKESRSQVRNIVGLKNGRDSGETLILRAPKGQSRSSLKLSGKRTETELFMMYDEDLTLKAYMSCMNSRAVSKLWYGFCYFP